MILILKFIYKNINKKINKFCDKVFKFSNNKLVLKYQKN